MVISDTSSPVDRKVAATVAVCSRGWPSADCSAIRPRGGVRAEEGGRDAPHEAVRRLLRRAERDGDGLERRIGDAALQLADESLLPRLRDRRSRRPPRRRTAGSWPNATAAGRPGRVAACPDCGERRRATQLCPQVRTHWCAVPQPWGGGEERRVCSARPVAGRPGPATSRLPTRRNPMPVHPGRTRLHPPREAVPRRGPHRPAAARGRRPSRPAPAPRRVRGPRGARRARPDRRCRRPSA